MGESIVEEKSQDCQVSEWGPWTSCDCGSGFYGSKTRQRTILQQPTGNGKVCPLLKESQTCLCLPSIFTPKDKPTPPTITEEEKSIIKSEEEIIEQKDTRTVDSIKTIDCKTSDWSEWSMCIPCSPNNPLGKSVRTRHILNLPSALGQKCPSSLREEKSCECPVKHDQILSPLQITLIAVGIFCILGVAVWYKIKSSSKVKPPSVN